MSQLEQYVKEIFIIILSLSFIEILVKGEPMEKMIKFIFSMIIMAVILSPLLKLRE